MDVAARVGHKGIATTMEIYAKDTAAMQEHTRDLLDKRYGLPTESVGKENGRQNVRQTAENDDSAVKPESREA